VVDMGELIQITSNADFSRLSRLVHSLHFIVLDSTSEKNGELFYFAKEPIPYGSSLSCSVDHTNKLNILTYRVYSKDEYTRIKTEIVKLGFASSGISESVGEFYEPEEFTKEK